jgi:hypothetical protein
MSANWLKPQKNLKKQLSIIIMEERGEQETFIEVLYRWLTGFKHARQSVMEGFRRRGRGVGGCHCCFVDLLHHIAHHTMPKGRPSKSVPPLAHNALGFEGFRKFLTGWSTC